MRCQNNFSCLLRLSQPKIHFSYLYNMDSSQLTYLTFGIVLALALVFDLGLLSKKGEAITIQKALWQTLFWVCLAMAFFGFLWFERGHQTAIEYISAF